MSLPDVKSRVMEALVYMRGNEGMAFLSGVWLGIRLTREMVTKELAGEWTTGLHLLASKTFMGDMRSWGMSMADFQIGLKAGSYDVISLPDEAFPHPELMENELGRNYAHGIFMAIQSVYQAGMAHFINGIAYDREEGPIAFHEWIDIVAEEIAVLFREEEEHYEK